MQAPVLSHLQLTLPTPFTIRRIEAENYRTVTLTFDGALDAYPGQFVMAWLPRFDEKPFSLVDADPVTLMVTDVGPFSHLVHGLRVGDRLWLRGPFGRGFHPQTEQQRLALVGGGYGVAPLLWLAHMHVTAVAQITAIVGARNARDLLYADRFQALGAQHPHLQVVTTTEDGTVGVKGRVTDALLPLIHDGQVDSIFACGPHGMLAALQSVGAQHGLPCQLSWEAYMRCGIGICGACEHDGQVLCLDGPVLQYAAVGVPAST